MNQQTNPQTLITLPDSLKAQMERAQNLLAQSARAESRGESDLAVIKAQEGLRILQTLATTSPGHAALLIAGEMGYRGYEIETVERVDRYQVVERTFLGIPVGHEVVNVPTITRTVKRGRLY